MSKRVILLVMAILTAVPSWCDIVDEPLSEYTDSVSNVVYSYNPEGTTAVVKARNYYEDVGARLSDITGYALNDYGVYGDISILDRFVVKGKEYKVTKIGKGAFYCNSRITSVTIPETVESIETDAFGLCTALKTVVLPSTLRDIGGAAFGRCTSLVEITIPEGITTIGSSSFSDCWNLKSIHIPASVTSIGYAAFCGCKGLSAITVDEANTIYDSRDECNAIIESNTSQLVFGCKTTTIPSSVIAIGSNAFRGQGISSIVIPGSVKDIGDYAFEMCSNLSEVILCDGIKFIGNQAFNNTAIVQLTIPPSVNGIGEYAFGGTKLTAITSLIIEPFEVNRICDFDVVKPMLYVPKGCKEKYEATNGWMQFKKIEEMETMGICDAPRLNDKGKMINDKRGGVYDLQGRRLTLKPENGVYIENGRKRVVK